MKELILPWGFKCKIEKNKIFTLYSPNGYFKMHGFPHKFWDAIYEYGDNYGKKWNADGEPLTPNTLKDYDFNNLRQIVYFTSVKQKIEIRKRVLEAHENWMKEERH